MHIYQPSSNYLDLYLIKTFLHLQSTMDLILTWLNEEVQLSVKISNIEEQFLNGYLFGELLAKYN